MLKIKDKKLIPWIIAILVTTLVFMILPMVSSSLGSFKQGDCISIRVLANCTNVNLTEVTILNNTYVINKQMTLLGGQTFNYTFCNTSYLGEYSYSWNNYCVDCSNNDCGNTFEVTPTGYTISTSKSIIILIGLFILFIIGAGLFFFGIYNQMPIIKIFSIGLSILIIAYSIGYGLNTMNNSIGEFTNLTSSFSSLFVLMTILLSVGGMGLILFLVYFVFKLWSKQRGFED